MKKSIITGISTLLISFSSCVTPGDPTPAVLAQDEVKQEVKNIVDSFKEVITNSSLDQVQKDQILDLLDQKMTEITNKLDLVIAYLMSVDDLDYSKVAKDVAARLKEIYESFKGKNK